MNFAGLEAHAFEGFGRRSDRVPSSDEVINEYHHAVVEIFIQAKGPYDLIAIRARGHFALVR